MSGRVPGGLPTVRLRVDGREVAAVAGQTVAAALLSGGVHVFRMSVTGEGRAPLCGMGTCFECRLTIDGVPHRRACMVEVADGMEVATRG